MLHPVELSSISYQCPLNIRDWSQISPLFVSCMPNYFAIILCRVCLICPSTLFFVCLWFRCVSGGWWLGGGGGWFLSRLRSGASALSMWTRVWTVPEVIGIVNKNQCFRLPWFDAPSLTVGEWPKDTHTIVAIWRRVRWVTFSLPGEARLVSPGLTYNCSRLLSYQSIAQEPPAYAYHGAWGL